MKTYFKTFAIITLSLLLTNCRKAPNSSRLQKSYEEAVKLHQAGNLNDAVFHYQSTALQCQYYPKDSLTYWWKAMCGQGEIWKEKNFLDYAQSDFEAVQQFAVRHRLDTAEYIACRKLTLIALEQQDYSKAKAYALRAHQISIKTPMSQEVTENQENERILSGSAYAIAYEKTFRIQCTGNSKGFPQILPWKSKPSPLSCFPYTKYKVQAFRRTCFSISEAKMSSRTNVSKNSPMPRNVRRNN